MQSKKINELGTNVSPSVNDLTVVGDAATGQLKKITLNQIASLFGSVGGVSSVAMTVPTGLTVTGSPITTSGTLAVTLTAGYSIPTNAKQSEWDAGYSERLKWDGGASGLSAPTARTSLGLVIGTDVLAYRTFGSAANNDTADFATAAQGTNADTAYTLRLTGASAPLSISGNVISLSQANTTTNGFLSSTDWNTFNGKQAALNGTGFVKITGTTISYDNSTYLTTSSASSTYLPLAGGTLTGPLDGTSATFNTTVAITLTASDSRIIGGNSTGRLILANSGTSTYAIFHGATHATNPNGILLINNNIESLKLTNTGAASFISSVTAATDLISSNGTLYVSAGSGLSYSSRLSTAYNFPYVDTYLDSFGGASYEGRLNFRINSGGGAMSTKMTILNNGSVGIGTTNPSFGKLQINTDNQSILALCTATNANQQLVLGYNLSGNYGRIQSINEGTSYTNLVLQKDGGNLLIATATDNGQGKLQVNGAITALNVSYTGEIVTGTTNLNTTYYHIISTAASSGSTFTLPSPTSNNLQYVIINKTIFSQTISAGSGFTIYDMAGNNSATISLAAKSRCYIIADGSSFYQIF